HPLVAALWLSIVRLAREWRERRRQGEAELADVRAVLDGLPQPLLLLDERRRIARANAAAGAVFGGEIVGHDLAVALRQPSLLDAADGVLAGGEGRIVECAWSDGRRFRVRLERFGAG